MADEKVFNIPLRDAFEKQRNKRASNASKIIRAFLVKNMKVESVKIGKSINDSLWKSGIENPPRKVRIHVVKEGDSVYAELLNVEIKTPSSADIKKKQDKKMEKEAKVKEDRKERRKKTIQDEIQEETEGKAAEDMPVSETKEPQKITS